MIEKSQQIQIPFPVGNLNKLIHIREVAIDNATVYKVFVPDVEMPYYITVIQ
jgi:hypothetical protein